VTSTVSINPVLRFDRADQHGPDPRRRFHGASRVSADAADVDKPIVRVTRDANAPALCRHSLALTSGRVHRLVLRTVDAQYLQED
jgi:hypothetical protein